MTLDSTILFRSDVGEEVDGNWYVCNSFTEIMPSDRIFPKFFSVLWAVGEGGGGAKCGTSSPYRLVCT